MDYNIRMFCIQCDAIRLEQFLRRCRLGQLSHGYSDDDSVKDQKYENIYISFLGVIEKNSLSKKYST